MVGKVWNLCEVILTIGTTLGLYGTVITALPALAASLYAFKTGDWQYIWCVGLYTFFVGMGIVSFTLLVVKDDIRDWRINRGR